MSTLTIAPFRGVRYNPEKVWDLTAVVAPPYDVISAEGQLRYYARHEYNVIRLILGQELPGDDERLNRYTRAGEFFRRWLEEGILVQDPVPCLYLSEERFVHPRDGKERRRRGVIPIVRLSPYEEGRVFPHERTFSKPKRDRLLLMRACQANLDPVFACYPSTLEPVEQTFEEAMGEEAFIDLTDDDGVRHQLWRLSDPVKIRQVARAFKEERVFIADGHHRYETALAFRDELSAADPAPPQVKATRSYNYVMMTLVSSHDPDLVILPTHRLLRTLPFPSSDPFLEAVGRFFDIQARPLREEGEIGKVIGEMERLGEKRRIIGMYDGEDCYLLILKDERLLAGIGGRPEGSQWTDVTLLHHLLIEGILGLDKASLEEGEIAYTRDGAEAIRLVQQGAYRLAFFLNPTKISEVQVATLVGERLPPKSTFFYPKLLSGLVFHRLDPNEPVEPPL
ncbi:MAG: DUF1015 domain-containing protein [candidate division NC10 bacterium]|nr:DUF1015 domain-containing protein [candidate division NC10 bacterium]